MVRETLGVTEAFGVSWCCNPTLSRESGPVHAAMWRLGKEQVATSRRREADGSLSPCVKGIDEYSGTGEKQERCLSAVESTALDCKQICCVVGEQFQTILSDALCHLHS